MEDLVLAIIVPCYNEEVIISKTNKLLSDVLIDLKHRRIVSENSYISYIDDGSTDSTWNEICKVSQNGIKLSKNFGHQNALLAGLYENEADIYITIDADLQDDITLIEKMVNEYKTGNEIVYGVRNNRKCDTFFKKFFAKLYYKFCEIIKMNTIPQHSEFRLISKKIVKILKDNNESTVYLRAKIANVGFKTSRLYYTRQARIGGYTKWTFFKLFEFAVDSITSCSIIPLKFIYVLGALSCIFACFIAICIMLKIFYQRYISSDLILLASVYFIGGVQLLSAGIIGEYIGNIYKETKKQQLYIVEDLINAK